LTPRWNAAFLLSFLALGCSKPKSAPKSDDLPPGAVPVVASGQPVPTLNNATPPPLPAAPPDVKTGPLSFAPVAKSADPSVVTIYALGPSEEGFFGRRAARVSKGLGTGFIVQTDGVIVTNNHVIEGADSIQVQFSDERRVSAHIAGRDPRTDIAVVKVDFRAGEQRELPAIALGDSDALEVGDWVVAIGNPFGLSHTVSAGIVSAKGRGRSDVPLDPSGYYNFLQTDASINPGNSGGPLLNLKGEVVGMNSAIRGGGAQGIGFAIPINMVKQILPTLLRDGKLVRSALGVGIRDARDLAPEDLETLKIGDQKGAVVVSLEPGGPAAQAKLQVGDIVVAFDGQPVDKSSLLQWKASTAGVGKTVSLRVLRAGKTFDLDVTLGELKEPKRTVRPRLPPPLDDEPER
jgi:serine protease Do